MHMLSYCSRSTIEPTRASAELRAIAHVSATNNPLLAVTGVLIFEGSFFVQVLEGERETLQRLSSRIKMDTRHAEFTVLADQPIESRHYGDWAMETFFVAEPNIVNVETLKGLSDVYQRNFEMQTNTYVDFLKHLVDQIDSFKIRLTAS